MSISSYKLLGDFTSDPHPESISINPFWVMAVIPFSRPASFSRDLVFAGKSSVSENISTDDLVNTDPPLILSDTVMTMNVSSGKDSHVSGLQATLLNDDDYLSKIQPGDWVMAWIINDASAAPALIKKIREFSAANDFKDGLKFVGRIQTVRKNLVQSPEGARTVRYQITGGGFHELDTSIFYDPALGEESPDLGDWITRLNLGLDQVYDAQRGGITSTKMIPTLLKLLVGEGIPPRTASPGKVQIVTGLTATEDAPFAYVIPPHVAQLLGKSTSTATVTSYADILELLLGVQKYTTGGSGYQALIPDGATKTGVNFRILNNNLLGTFMPLPVAFDNKNIWSILGQFLNPAVNEMYTALKVNPLGQVVPTLVVRQKPFSTPVAVSKLSAATVTSFLEVPRWDADAILINSLDVGKSDALRFNFIHIYGEAAGEGGQTLTEQIIRNPPIRDDTDIKRHGLRAHMETVPCGIDDTLSAPRVWMEIIADFLIGQQFTLTGTVNMLGIQTPIAAGDNFQFDDTVYQIESVAHSCGIDMGGRKFFTTVLTLSHGLRAAASTDSPIYPGQGDLDNSTYDPGTTIERAVDPRPTLLAGSSSTNGGLA